MTLTLNIRTLFAARKPAPVCNRRNLERAIGFYVEVTADYRNGAIGKIVAVDSSDDTYQVSIAVGGHSGGFTESAWFNAKELALIGIARIQ